MSNRQHIGTIKPDKIWMKDKEEWVGQAVCLRLNKQQSKDFAGMIAKVAELTDKADITIYPKKKIHKITITYAKD